MTFLKWLFRKPYGLVPRALLHQINTERAHWQRWCEQAEARLPPDPDNTRWAAEDDG